MNNLQGPPREIQVKHGPPWIVFDCPNCDWKRVSATIPEFWVESDCPNCDTLVMPVRVEPAAENESWAADDASEILT